ncbi:hypothetical protein [Actinocatenispora rupis]|uniref:Membrane protein n=1 Tax=Actinocatenispora rupis TaxID=519421 RepID=A0A8J3J100_9ACTN|nr:hypothetical protein [Actinocatenispora rupis]GID12570.1 membrane protein [Actinocatenispora rupis]
MRRLLLCVHVLASVGWLGLTIGDLTLALTGLATGDPVRQLAAYLALDTIAGTVLLPVALTAYATGLLQGLVTRWGLLRYRWVVAKLLLTTVAVVLTPLALLPSVHAAASAVTGASGRLVDLGADGRNLVVAGCVSLTLYSVNTVLSLLKPGGRTRYGRRLLARTRVEPARAATRQVRDGRDVVPEP